MPIQVISTENYVKKGEEVLRRFEDDELFVTAGYEIQAPMIHVDDQEQTLHIIGTPAEPLTAGELRGVGVGVEEAYDAGMLLRFDRSTGNTYASERSTINRFRHTPREFTPVASTDPTAAQTTQVLKGYEALPRPNTFKVDVDQPVIQHTRVPTPSIQPLSPPGNAELGRAAESLTGNAVGLPSIPSGEGVNIPDISAFLNQ